MPSAPPTPTPPRTPAEIQRIAAAKVANILAGLALLSQPARGNA